MRPIWQKLASLAQKSCHSSFSSLVHSLLQNDNLCKNKFGQLLHDDAISTTFSSADTQS